MVVLYGVRLIILPSITYCFLNRTPGRHTAAVYYPAGIPANSRLTKYTSVCPQTLYAAAAVRTSIYTA